jgi:ABC-type oligopeptide transport system substrate-binding subunit
VSRAPGIKTVYKRNAAWWGKFEGNVQEVVYTPIKSDPTRTAALISALREGERFDSVWSRLSADPAVLDRY